MSSAGRLKVKLGARCGRAEKLSSEMAFGDGRVKVCWVLPVSTNIEGFSSPLTLGTVCMVAEGCF